MSGYPARLLVAVALTLGASLVGPPAADACACGGVFVPPSSSSSVPTEKALIVHAGGREEVTMELHLRSDAEQAGLVVPTPTPATVGLADPQVFDALRFATAPEYRTRRHLIGDSEDRGVAGSVPTGAGDSGVRELSSVDLGPLRATTLQAGDAAALRQWLSSRGYVVRPDVQKILNFYVAQRWSFVAMQLTPQGAALNGNLPPITMSFDSGSIIYPMRMSQAAKNSPSVTTYVLSDHRVQRTDATSSRSSVSTFFAGRVKPTTSSTTVNEALKKAPFLTGSRQHFGEPSTQIVSDFTFARAASDDPHREVVWRDQYLMTPGQFLLVLMFGAVGIAALWRAVTHLRSRRS